MLAFTHLWKISDTTSMPTTTCDADHPVSVLKGRFSHQLPFEIHCLGHITQHLMLSSQLKQLLMHQQPPTGVYANNDGPEKEQ